MDTLWVPIGVLSALGLLSGLALGYAALRFKVAEDSMSSRIDDILPQSQCGQCGYLGCRPYAKAVVNGEMINKCVPGGEKIMLKLAELLNIDPQPLGAGIVADPVQRIAYIDESNCIGCTKCTRICPVDAIVGATRTMHTVIPGICTGCSLCVAPCPTDCIEMRPVAHASTNWKESAKLIPVRVIHMEHKC